MLRRAEDIRRLIRRRLAPTGPAGYPSRDVGEQVAGGTRGRQVASDPDGAEGAAQIQVGDWDPVETVRRYVIRDGELAEDSGAGAGENGGPHGSGSGERKRHRHRHPRLQGRRQGGGEDAAGSGSFFPADDPHGRQLIRAQRVAALGPWVVGPDHDRKLIMADDAGPQALRAGGSLDEPQV
jgi:hypothetical protein